MSLSFDFKMVRALPIIALLGLAACAADGQGPVTQNHMQTAVTAPARPYREVREIGPVTVVISSLFPDGGITVRDVQSHWEAGYQRVSMTVEGAFSGVINARAHWRDKNGKLIERDLTFIERFSLDPFGRKTVSWRSPVPQGRSVEIDLSCDNC